MFSLLVLLFLPLITSQIDDLSSVEILDITASEFDQYFDAVLSRASENELDAVESLQKVVRDCENDRREKDKISCIVPEYASIVLKYGR